MSKSNDITENYFLIEPSDGRIDPQTGVEACRTLSQLQPDSGWRSRLPLATEPESYTYEWTVTAHPRESGTALQYYVGTDEALGTETLKPHLRTMFPNSYELKQQSNCAPLSQFRSPDWAYAVEAVGAPQCYSDWFTQLQSFGPYDDTSSRHPMTALLEALQDSETPCLLQICAQPTDKLSGYTKQDIKFYLERDCKQANGPLVTSIFGSFPDKKPREELHYESRNRLSHLEAKESDAFAVSIRVLIGDGSNARLTADKLASVMGTISGEYYKINGKCHEETERVREAIQQRRVVTPTYNYVPGLIPSNRDMSRGLVVDYKELGGLIFPDGDDLTEPTRRALNTKSDTTGLTTPPAPEVLDSYQHGPSLGRVRNSEGIVEDTTVCLPPALQQLHTLLVGGTGSGKTGITENNILDNSELTDGADIALIGSVESLDGVGIVR